MQMQHILSLVALLEAGSLRSAAASLGRSQPGLTKNLRQIEDELGVRLFQRTSRGVIPTKIGQLVLARTRPIATDIRRLQEEVEQTKGGQHGTVGSCPRPWCRSGYPEQRWLLDQAATVGRVTRGASLRGVMV